MHKEHLAQDENSNPREGPGSRKKDKLSPSEQDMNHINKSKAKTGSWESNGFGPDPEIETLAGRTEDSVPLSPSNSLNLRHLRGCERDPSGRQHQRSPSSHHHSYSYSSHHHHYRPFYSGYRKGYWDYESQYRDGKRKEWVPRPGGGSRTQRPRNREAFNSTECVDGRPEQAGVEKAKTVPAPATPRQPSPPAKEEHTADSWVLFKPLPVFPVDSSSARTLPKISYASKVKENLDGKGLVPSSALRTSNSLPNCLLAASVAGGNTDPTSPQTPGSLCSSSCSSLSSAPPSPVSQDNLGAIFQNEWGLSFINDPGAGQAPVASQGSKDGPEGEEESHAATPVSVLDRLNLHGFYVDRVEDDDACLENPRDWEAMVNYSMQEWNLAWTIHKKDPSRVVVYAESMDGKG
ncbi:hypothetical protein XENTR_v10023275 [Xenopus tropicalis]|uniref:LOC100145486 protein n=1 Tax=Xenopus tropicalis TaxID=8364 RepID=B1H2U1_XENTR|nr:uncharacterized protein LOC100145486 [Xenopus tropicalis]AAI61130.1 LOC100145486 protein [Xenopus tropicalis]KAE8578017.1 hypothetical protein XENTR_v10023275 [Xenopus tropicalis]|eukprot:NP_001120409.1 uncharacterized protein LOC100145486 [Xenopus tropicalis]